MALTYPAAYSIGIVQTMKPITKLPVKMLSKLAAGTTRQPVDNTMKSADTGYSKWRPPNRELLNIAFYN